MFVAVVFEVNILLRLVRLHVKTADLVTLVHWDLLHGLFVVQVSIVEVLLQHQVVEVVVKVIIVALHPINGVVSVRVVGIQMCMAYLPVHTVQMESISGIQADGLLILNVTTVQKADIRGIKSVP